MTQQTETSADQSADTSPSAPPAPARPETLDVKADSSTPSPVPLTPPTPPPPPPIAVSDPVVQTNQLSRDSSVVDDDSPREIFKKVVVNDARQNKRLSAKFNGGSSSSNGSAFNSRSDLVEDNPKGSTRMRFIVCTLGLMSLAMSQMSRMVINQSITQMVEPHKEAAKKDDAIVGNEFRADDGSCPWPEQLVVDSATITTLASTTMAPPTRNSPATSSPMQPVNPMLPVLPTSQPTTTTTTTSGANLEELPDFMSELDKKVVRSNETTIAAPKQEDNSNNKNQYERFNWSIKDQNLVLGGFYWSYFVFMILGGRLAEVYGSKYIILLSVAGSALINLATPWMARSSLTMLVMSRVLMGAIQSGVFPALYALIAKWLTMSEASIFAPLIKMNLRLGMVFGSLVPGLVPGWPNVFYFTGVVSVLWSVAWLFIATSDPADNSWVSAGELKHINRKKKRTIEAEAQVEGIELESGNGQVAASTKLKPSKRSLKTPWLKIITSPSVVGLILVKLTLNYALDFLAIELPSYLRYVHHATGKQISAITTPMFAIQVFLIVFVGWLAKVVIQRRPLGVSKTTVRKLFQGLTSFGMAATFFLLTFNNCNLIFVTILLQLVSFLSMFTAGGETMLPYDLSEEYPATIMSIANSIANVSGITTTTLASIVLADQGGSYQRWNILIYLIAGANLLGGLAFTFLVKAEPIDFESKKKKKETKQKVLTINSTSAPASENNETTRK